MKEMSFWEHVEDLRKVILRSVGAIILLAIVFFALMPHIFDSVILAPCHSDFVLYRWLCALNQHMAILPDFCNDQFEVKLINIQLASQFFIHMSTSMWLALLVAFPYVIYQLWSFVSPEKPDISFVTMTLFRRDSSSKLVRFLKISVPSV